MNRCGVLRRAGAPPATLGPRCVLAFFFLLPANEHRVRPSKGEPTVPRVQGRRHPLAVREKFEASCFHGLHSLDGRNSDLRLFLRGQLFETRCGALLLFLFFLSVRGKKEDSQLLRRTLLSGRQETIHASVPSLRKPHRCLFVEFRERLGLSLDPLRRRLVTSSYRTFFFTIVT